MMTPRHPIQAQLEVLRREIVRSRKAIESVEVEADLRTRVAPRFDTELTRLQKKADSLAKQVTAGQPLEGCWRQLRTLQNETTQVFDECLAFVQGGLARKASLDDGICSLTDALLDDLAAWSDIPWGRFTLLATSEFYRETADIIRIRYPDVSLWSMPFAAHEFGHYLGAQLRHSQDGGYVYPLQELLREADQGRTGASHTSTWHHLQEWFADLFATCALGPAYVAALIVLRMDPREAHVETYTHPSGAARVHGALWVLDKLDSQLVFSPFRDVTTLLRTLWKESLEAAGQASAISDAEAALVLHRMTELFDLLASNTPERLAVGRSDLLRAEALAAEFPGLMAHGSPVAATPATLPDKLTRRDVLNAAWLARLGTADQSPQALNDIARSALATYRRVETSQAVKRVDA